MKTVLKVSGLVALVAIIKVTNVTGTGFGEFWL